jgi:hypothetical protein
LFAATWLAVELSGTATVTVAVVLGLVIWGLFYVSITLFEATALSSLVGYLVSAATTGLKSLSSLFSKSEGRRLADTSALVAAAVREEILGTSEIKKTRRALERYFKESYLPVLDPAKVKKEILDLLENVEIRATVEDGDTDHHEKTLVAAVQAKRDGGKHGYGMVHKADQAIADVKEVYYSDTDRPSKVVDAILRLSGKSQEEAHRVREEVEDFLLSTNREELHPEEIKEEVDVLISNPKEGYAQLKRHLSRMAPETLGALVARGTALTEDEANAIIGAIVQAAKETLTLGKSEWDSARASLKEKFQSYLDGLGRPELSYDQICHDIEEIVADPKSAPEVLRQRLQALDRETLVTILASRKDISEDDARRIVERIEGLRDEIAHKSEQITSEIQRRVEQAQLKASEVAEQGRKQIEIAAWWVFATAAVSAVASILGALVAIKTA